MEKEKLLIRASNFGMEIQSNSMDQSDPFESALSSIVSSPAASNGPTGDCFMIRELIGRLGNIYNSAEISSQSYIQAPNNNSTATSCYSTPLNSPPKITTNLPNTLASDPGFVRIQLNETESGKLSTNQSVKVGGSQENNNGNKKFSRLPIPDHNADQVDSKEESSASELISKPPNDHLNARKRKSIPKGKLIAETDESNTKRSKQDETEYVKAEAKKDNPKPSEPPKDYIHVRARRGQATDSHSLAERVRREKISERMKYLQDLVPGCNKVTGKAVMLDEIINYVQSLQRQVEFLSMKLATVNPRMDFNMEALLSKDMVQFRGSEQHTLYNYPIDSSAPTFPFGFEPQQGLPLHSNNNNNYYNNGENQVLMNPFHRNSSMQLPPINGCGEAISQFASFWEDDLQSLVQMGFNRSQPQSFHGSMAAAQMKIEF